ncbi:unnamed protein product [Phytophthora fragariaefolia]|uniref:Unnamed protein product n=1 Tax=Phytophthora fragariaefolia TaxID=1490495 RepID=A0A9W6Y9E4_9STRA|nr:unnamed protein product [Phytophthora fragariaefolia]
MPRAVLDLKPPPNFFYVTNTVIRQVGGSAGSTAISTSGSPPADTAPAVSPTIAPPLAPSAAETAAPDSLPSSGEPGGQSSTLLTPPSAPRTDAESASARSPTPVTAEFSTEPEDSAVGSTSPPLSSVSSAPTQPISVSLGLRSGAGDSLSSPPEVSWCRKGVCAAWSY